ncbi:DUF4157 domain-containing protein [Yinghuangia aomiensis]|uniref:DUF4157 domain-containing protein n=1 Tax=Yinghuangia aomiensis TaxID=676205 RepID=A0ABP9I2P0_9ACTN
MRAHDHDHDHDEDRTGTRAGPEHDHEHAALVYRAAALGRPDVVGRAGLSSLQRAAGNGAVRAMLADDEKDRAPAAQRAAAEPAPRSRVHEVVGSGGGAPMDGDTRADMEARLGADFGDVRIHTDGRAHESAAEVGAHAYTVGSDVVFQRGMYDPGSHDGKTMLAHELTHVVQQRSGPVEGTETAGGIRVSDPSDRFEREAVANADRVMSLPAPTAPTPDVGTGATSAAAAPAGPSAPVQRAVDEGAEGAATAAAVQREEDEDEEPADVQGAFVQRAEDKTDEEEDEPAE